MKMIVLSVLAATSLLCKPVLAQVYIGGTLGFTSSNVNCAGTISCDRTSTGFRLYGGYKFSPHIAGEFGYHDMGRVQFNGSFNGAPYRSALKGSGVGVGLKLRAPINRRWSGVARLGVASNETQVDFTSGKTDLTNSETHTTGYGGLGVSYAIDRNSSVEAMVEFTRLKYAAQSSDLRMSSVGMSYAF